MTRSAGSVPEGSDEDAAAAPRGARRRVRDRRPEHRVRLPLLLAPRRHGPLLLGEEGDRRGQLVDAAGRSGRGSPSTSSAGHDPVAGGGVLEDDDVAALLAAEPGPGHLHPLEDVLVADRASGRARPPAAASAASRPPFERTVTTRMPPGSAPRRRRSSAQMPRSWSPSTTWPRSVDHDEAVGVAVEGEAEVRPARHDLRGEGRRAPWPRSRR